MRQIFRPLQSILQRPWMRDVRNIALLSITTIILMQAITNADLIRLMATNWIYGIQSIATPQRTLSLSTSSATSTDTIQKLLASTESTSVRSTSIAPTLEQTLSTKSDSYDFQFNTLPPINKVTISDLGIDAPIVSVFFAEAEDVMVGDFNDVLQDGVAVYPGTALPGNQGHSLIFGHSSQERRKKNDYNTIFSMIGDLEPGDTFTVTWGGKLLTYRVTQQQVVDPTNVIDIYNEHNTDNASHLSLITCRPRGTDRNRMVVTSELIDSDTDTADLLTYHSN